MDVEQEVIPPTKGRRGRGRPSDYSQEIAERICEGIARGRSLIDICDEPDMPAYSSVTKWKRERSDFSAMFAQAREDQADWHADLMLRIAMDTSQDWIQDPETREWKPNYDVVQRVKLKLEQLRWNASKLKPKTYGDRVEARIEGALDVRSVNVNIDASQMTAEQRELLRVAVLGRLPRPDSGGDDA